MALVLTRRVGDQVYIADNIVLTVTEVRGGKVRLAFDAPVDVRIDRAEVRRMREQDERRRGAG